MLEPTQVLGLVLGVGFFAGLVIVWALTWPGWKAFQ